MANPTATSGQSVMVEGTVTLSCDDAVIRLTGTPDGRLRIDVADLATLQMLRDLSAALPAGESPKGKRELARNTTQALDTLGLTIDVVVAGQRVAEAGHGITPGTIAKLMNLGPVHADKSAILKLGKQLL
ncbi:MAG: hypothetical protein AAF663_03670 [Planctomycetota bacterium]